MAEPVNDTPPTDTYTPTKKKSGFPLGRLLTILAILFALIAAASKYYLSFYVFDERYYAKVFYSWRCGFANKQMFADTWKFIPKNKYDKEKTPEYFSLIEFAQENRYLFDGHPEHFPRQQKGYFTHGGDNDFNKLLCEWRKNLSEIDTSYDKEVFEGKALLTDKMRQWWLGTNEKNTNDAHYYYARTDVKVKEFMWELATFLNKIHNDYYKKQNAFIGFDVSEIILKDIKKIIDKTGYVFRVEPTKGQKPEEAAELDEKKALDVIKLVVLDMVNARAKTGPCFALSRAMYAVAFTLAKKRFEIYSHLTKGVNDEKDTKTKDKAQEYLNKMKKSGSFRLERISQCITYLLIKLCKHPYNAPDVERNVVVDWILNIFRPNYLPLLDDSEPLDEIIAGLNETIGFKYDANNATPAFKFEERPETQGSTEEQEQKNPKLGAEGQTTSTGADAPVTEPKGSESATGTEEPVTEPKGSESATGTEEPVTEPKGSEAAAGEGESVPPCSGAAAGAGASAEGSAGAGADGSAGAGASAEGSAGAGAGAEGSAAGAGASAEGSAASAGATAEGVVTGAGTSTAASAEVLPGSEQEAKFIASNSFPIHLPAPDAQPSSAVCNDQVGGNAGKPKGTATSGTQ